MGVFINRSKWSLSLFSRPTRLEVMLASNQVSIRVSPLKRSRPIRLVPTADNRSSQRKLKFFEMGLAVSLNFVIAFSVLGGQSSCIFGATSDGTLFWWTQNLATNCTFRSLRYGVLGAFLDKIRTSSSLSFYRNSLFSLNCGLLHVKTNCLVANNKSWWNVAARLNTNSPKFH